MKFASKLCNQTCVDANLRRWNSKRGLMPSDCTVEIFIAEDSGNPFALCDSFKFVGETKNDVFMMTLIFFWNYLLQKFKSHFPFKFKEIGIELCNGQRLQESESCYNFWHCVGVAYMKNFILDVKVNPSCNAAQRFYLLSA